MGDFKIGDIVRDIYPTGFCSKYPPLYRITEWKEGHAPHVEEFEFELCNKIYMRTSTWGIFDLSALAKMKKASRWERKQVEKAKDSRDL